MNNIMLLQNYWWLLICVLAGVLVFMLFVQGGQSMLLTTRNHMHRTMMINSLGRKWELTFTSLVVFGGAFFASFPLFYSTSFGGAYWLWMLILISFVIQAVSYEFRRKAGNVWGTNAYDVCLFINGCVGCVLLGVAVAMMFFGAEFTVAKGNLLNGESPVISTWSSTHGLEAIASWRNLLLGFTVFFLARTQAALYFLNNTDGDNKFYHENQKRVVVNGGIFVVLFLWFVWELINADGYLVEADGMVLVDPGKYLTNLIEMWWWGAVMLIGVVMVLYGILRTVLGRRYTGGIWWTGIGSALVVITLLAIAGYNDTAYYPSLIDAQSSLTIRNSSSSLFTLRVMTVVSFIIPVVIAYIAYAWRKIDSQPITPEEMTSDDHQY